MKTEYNREPEFLMTYKHIGIQVTFSVRVLAQEYLTTAADDQDNEENLNNLLQSATLSANQQVLTLLHKAHSEFDKALSESYRAQILSRALSSTNINHDENNTAQTNESQKEPATTIGVSAGGS
ncbi:MAG: hypothetical protein IPI17_12615 [Nitrosomonas sp.]|jgi:lipopolysaccharide biosynthesis regulator YciM|nr:hypothetical protein [Nitrosomonas sp.]